MKELTIPPAAERDENSVEVIRAWFAEKGLWVSLNPHVFRDRDLKEEDAWGIVLADTIRHLANARCLVSGNSQEETIKLIKEALDTEILKPTSTVRGGFIG
ncbi:MAG: DUF5076 domain-containing protein [Gammaproteobacteria bacterium]|nr:DUF5076 domain-containing protein [Gammaproteobacteria bacterium]